MPAAKRKNAFSNRGASARKYVKRTYAKRSYPKRTFSTSTAMGPVKYSRPYRESKAQSTSVNPVLNNILRSVGGGLGNMLAPGVGGAVGGEMANTAHHLFKKITGWGDYDVDSNTLVKGDSVPQFTNAGRITRVQHREYIQDIYTSTTAGAFNINVFPINPGLSTTFPWLSSVARRYEEYRIKGMIFEYKTMSSDALNSTNTALGSVIMTTQYNVLSPAFIDKQQMENYEFGCSTKPSCSLVHPVECDPHETPIGELFVRSDGENVVGSDRRMYDLGNFSIATVGGQAANINLGELWVSYDVELIKPKLRDQGASVGTSDHYVLSPSGISTGLFVGSSLASGSNLQTTANNNTINFPSNFTGNVMVTVAIVGTAATLSAKSLTMGSNVSLFNGLAGVGNLLSGGNSGVYLQTICLNVALPQAGIPSGLSFSGGTLPTSITNGDVWVTQLETQ